MRTTILASILTALVFQSCSYTSYEYIHNKSGKDITVLIRPAIPDTISNIKANNFLNQGVSVSLDKTNNSAVYVIKNKGWLKLGQAYDGLGKEDLSFNYMEVVKNEHDTTTYEGKHDIVNAFKKQSFTKYQFVKVVKKKGEKSAAKNEKSGGWIYIVKKT